MKKFFSLVAVALFATSMFAEIAVKTAPAEPTLPATAVYSLFGYYGGDWNSEGWGAIPTLEEVEGVEILYATKFGWDIFDTKDAEGVETHDLSEYENFHVSFWSNCDAYLKLTWESADNVDPKTAKQVEIVAGWNEIDLPLSAWEGVTFKFIKYFILEGYTEDEAGTVGLESEDHPVAYANAYFYKGAQGVEETAAAAKAIKAIENGKIVVIRNNQKFDVIGNQL